MVGVVWVAATNHSATIATAAEVRTSHLTMVDNHGKTLFEAQCLDDNLYLKDYAGAVTNFGQW
jgi:hypothetical protein